MYNLTYLWYNSYMMKTSNKPLGIIFILMSIIAMGVAYKIVLPPLDMSVWLLTVLLFIVWDRFMALGIALFLGVELEDKND